MGQRVFHPPNFWLTKDANAFMTKNLTLIPEQKRELESVSSSKTAFSKISRKFLVTKPVFS